ncbi:hypothetical protein ABMB68_009470 [Bradyrhizobium sp. RT4a]
MKQGHVAVVPFLFDLEATKLLTSIVCCLASLSGNASVSSGTWVSLDHGHFNIAPLLHEGAHTASPTSDAERFHDRPSQPEGVADRVIDLLDRGQVIVHQPEHLAPHCLLEPVCDEAVYLFAHHERVHSESPVDIRRPLQRLGCRPLATTQFDQRQHVDRVEGVRDKKALRPIHLNL